MKKTVCKWLSVVSLVLSFTGTAFGAEWEEADQEDGITSYRKDEPGSSVTAFKGETMLNAPLAKVAWVIRDNDHRTKWVNRLKLSRVLESKSDFDKIIYQHFELPAFIADRDYVYRAKVYWQGEKLVFDLKSTQSPRAPKTVGVRANLIRCLYYLTPWGENRTHIQVEVHTDPMGSLPAWFVNLIQKSWPIKTLSGIRKMVKEPYAKMSKLPPKPNQKPDLKNGIEGSSGGSCGADEQSAPVDCTALGDKHATCVYSDHCLCSTGFVCEKTGVPGECAPGDRCAPAGGQAPSTAPSAP